VGIITDSPELFVLQPFCDFRGSFTKIVDFSKLKFPILETSIARTKKKGVIRGLHYLDENLNEHKYIHCSQGSIYDVVVDMRSQSPTLRTFITFHLSSERPSLLRVPPGFAHGYLTLTRDVEVIYGMTAEYDSSRERGVRWDDPSLAIPWPIRPKYVSQKDSSWDLLEAN
jgi:dTDP-4-dehydrorhamnose 3,5-epimerase